MKSHRSQAFLIALGLCVAFYWVILQPSMRHTVLHTYTTEHATEYAIVGLFCWATSDLALSYVRNRRELRSIRYNWLPGREGIEPVGNAESIYIHVYAGPRALHDSMMFERLKNALAYVRERRSAVGFREYLNDLAVRDSDRTYARYGFPRFATGVLPILGLLGTVVHFGGALSGLSSDDLVSKVPQIVSGMGTAFNTTCAALTASTTTMLFRFLVETQEEAALAKINEYVEDQLLHRFVAEEPDASSSMRLEGTLSQLAQVLETVLAERQTNSRSVA